MTTQVITRPLARRGLLRATSAAVAGAAGAALLGACARNDSAPSSVAQAGPATATVLSFNNPLFQDSKDDLVRAVAKTDPDLKPDIIVFPGQIAEFRLKMLAIYAGGDVPDAQWIHPSITSLGASKKLTRSLDDLAKRDKLAPLSEFYQGVLDYFRWKGQAYGLPWYSPGYAFIYNKQLFSKMSVTAPDQLEKDGKWTWDAFVSTLRSLTTGTAGSPDRTIGFAAFNMNLDWICATVWRNGGDIFSKDLKKFVLNEAAGVDAIQSVLDLHLKYNAINYGTNTKDFPDAFNSGRIGMRQANKEQTAPARKDLSVATFPLGMVAVPKGKAGRVNRMGPLGFGVAQNGPHGDAGWRWVRFMSGPDAAAVLMAAQSTLPVRPKFAQLPEYAKSMQPYENRDVWLESQATARAMDQPGVYDDIATLWTNTWNDILAQKGTVKSLLDDLARQVNALLAQEQ
jgi:arabinogalactan oligomer/maltooligosaccharide transport system substrate-binding protein